MTIATQPTDAAVILDKFLAVFDEPINSPAERCMTIGWCIFQTLGGDPSAYLWRASA